MLLHLKYFYPRSPCGERPAFDVLAVSALLISIHALLAESDFAFSKLLVMLTPISIHALLAESDQTGLTCGGGQNISIHALLAESDNGRPETRQPCAISIHALLAESDWWLRCWKLAARDISIHALLAESDRRWACSVGFAFSFLSTLSLRRAT